MQTEQTKKYDSYRNRKQPASRRPIRLIVMSLLLLMGLLGGSVPSTQAQEPQPNLKTKQGAYDTWRDDPLAGDNLITALEEAKLLSNVSEIYLDSVSTSVSGNVISMNNLRATSDSTDLDDYIWVKFLFDTDTLRLTPTDLGVIPDIGVYYRSEHLFAKDVRTTLTMTTPDGGKLAADKLYKINATATSQFKINLEAGTVLTLRLKEPSENYKLIINHPNGAVYENNLFRKGSNWVAYGRTIFRTGTYTFRFVPQNSSNVSLTFGFTNNNRSALKDIASGDRIATTLSGWGREYAKYRFQLNTASRVEISDPTDDDIWLYLINANNRVIDSGTGEIFTNIAYPGTYYLFVLNKSSNRSTYSGQLKITPDSNWSQYPRFTTVSGQTATQGSPFKLQLSATSGSQVSYSAVGLPTDLSLDKQSGLISGVPNIAGSYSVRVWASNNVGTVRQQFLLTVQEAASRQRAVSPAEVRMQQQADFFSLSLADNPTHDSLVGMLNKIDQLKNIREVRLDGVTTSLSGNVLSLHNLRVKSDSTSLNDYIKVQFLFDAAAFRLVPIALNITSDLGIYHRDEDFFSKDVATNLTMSTPDGKTLAADQLYQLTATSQDKFTINLEAGTTFTMRSVKPTSDYNLEITSPSGGSYEWNLFRKGSNWTLFGRSILETGTYTFRFLPRQASSVRLEFGFSNNNRSKLRDVVSGDRISASLNGWGQEYAKYRLNLNAGDLVKVTDPTDDNVWLYLLNSNSRSIDSGSGEIYVRVSSGGEYYLFVVKKNYAGTASYSGQVTITPDSNRINYPKISTIPKYVVDKGSTFKLDLSIFVSSDSAVTYRVTGLPNGFSLDSKTGLLTGVAKVPGSYPIRLSVSNTAGRSQQDFLLVVDNTTLPSAKLLGFSQVSDCEWKGQIALSNFAPNSSITIKEHTLDLGCPGITLDQETTTKIYPTKTDQNGNLTLELPYDSIGIYDYLFTDQANNQIEFWFTSMVTLPPITTTPPITDSTRRINVTMSLYKSAATAAEREPYEKIFGHFADAVYEQSNGAHKIGQVTIYTNQAYWDLAHIQWTKSNWPKAHVAGYGKQRQHVYMADIEDFVTFQKNALLEKNQRGTGYTLGHEWGHYFYGVYDEYKASRNNPSIGNNRPGSPRGDDKPVKNSIMHAQYLADRNEDFNWLNFSVPKNQTFKNAQYRVYGASAWETIARSPSLDTRPGRDYYIPKRAYYPELAGVEPGANQDASLQLPAGQAEARSALTINWVNGNARNSRQDDSRYQVTVRSDIGAEFDYPKPVMIVASVAKTVPLAKARVTARAVNPDQTQTIFLLKDDGVAPDASADDGLYTGYLPYSQAGRYSVNVTFDNDSGKAVTTEESFEHAPGPNGEIYVSHSQPIGENFRVTGSMQIVVRKSGKDDYGDTAKTASELPTNNVNLSGIIDSAGDVDLFKVTPSKDGTLVVRVTNLGPEMLPQIRLIDADGTTTLKTFTFTPKDDYDYFFTVLKATTNKAFYVEIAHQDKSTTGGTYAISAGKSLGSGGEPKDTSSEVYLPIVIR